MPRSSWQKPSPLARTTRAETDLLGPAGQLIYRAGPWMLAQGRAGFPGQTPPHTAPSPPFLDSRDPSRRLWPTAATTPGQHNRQHPRGGTWVPFVGRPDAWRAALHAEHVHRSFGGAEEPAEAQEGADSHGRCGSPILGQRAQDSSRRGPAPPPWGTESSAGPLGWERIPELMATHPSR